MNSAWRRGLYAITDPALTPAPTLIEQVRAALAGGAVMLQYRDKLSGAAEKHRLARALLAECRAAGAPLIINDDIELAAAIGAGGVHLGRDDAALSEARARLGAAAIIGVSCYAELPRAAHAENSGADYVAFGRFFPSRTKPDAVQARPALLREAKRRLRIPVTAIGGINADNGAELIAAGADLLAVIDGVFGQADTRAAAAQIAALWAPPAQRARANQ